MSNTHGKEAVIKIDNSGGSLTAITSYIKSSPLKQSAEVAETTTFGATAKTFIAGLLDGSLSLEGYFDSAVDAILSAAVGVQRSFECGPEGSATGDIKYTGECICTSYDISPAVDGVVTVSAEFQITGAVTRGTYA